jgi:hypothetical protein
LGGRLGELIRGTSRDHAPPFASLYPLEWCPPLRKVRDGVVELAGFEVPDEHVLELVALLEKARYDETAERLAYAVKWGDEVGLRIADRLAILDVLDDAPEGLGDLRRVLASEHRWRVRHGLV